MRSYFISSSPRKKMNVNRKTCRLFTIRIALDFIRYPRWKKVLSRSHVIIFDEIGNAENILFYWD